MNEKRKAHLGSLFVVIVEKELHRLGPRVRVVTDGRSALGRRRPVAPPAGSPVVAVDTVQQRAIDNLTLVTYTVARHVVDAEVHHAARLVHVDGADVVLAGAVALGLVRRGLDAAEVSLAQEQGYCW